jgi:hypothetical protein
MVDLAPRTLIDVRRVHWYLGTLDERVGRRLYVSLTGPAGV